MANFYYDYTEDFTGQVNILFESQKINIIGTEGVEYNPASVFTRFQKAGVDQFTIDVSGNVRSTTGNIRGATITCDGLLTTGSMTVAGAINVDSITATGTIQADALISDTTVVAGTGISSTTGNIQAVAGDVLGVNLTATNSVSGDKGSFAGSCNASYYQAGLRGQVPASVAGDVFGDQTVVLRHRTDDALAADPLIGAAYPDGGSVAWVSDGTQTGADGDYLVKTRSSAGSEQILNLTTAAAPVGAVTMWPTDTPPSNHLICDGSLVSTTTYAALFAIIGYDYGGSGPSFNLPDYRGMFIRGHDPVAASGPGYGESRTDRGDGTSGVNVGTRQADAIQAHTHGVDNFVEAAGSNGPIRNQVGSDNSLLSGGVEGAPTSATETRPDNVSVNFIIKYR